MAPTRSARRPNMRRCCSLNTAARRSVSSDFLEEVVRAFPYAGSPTGLLCPRVDDERLHLRDALDVDEEEDLVRVLFGLPEASEVQAVAPLASA